MSAANADLAGLSGWVADVIDASGAVGVGLLTLLETVFPPIPSEVVLPLAGFLSGQGRMSLPAVLVTSTLGSVAGAVALYVLGRRLGEERATRLLARLPLVDDHDIERAVGWFHRHGRPAVFLGRLIPGVRSLISLPAGAEHMPVPQFVVLTAAGSALWNCLLVGAGVALGTRWDQVERYAGILDWVLIGAVMVVVGIGVVRRLQRGHESRRA